MSTYTFVPEMSTQLEIKNTFLQFPIPVIAPLAYTPCRRSVSCPAKGPRFAVKEALRVDDYAHNHLDTFALLAGGKDNERWADVVDAAESTQCSTRSCNGSLEDSTIESHSSRNMEGTENVPATTKRPRRRGRQNQTGNSASTAMNTNVNGSCIPDDSCAGNGVWNTISVGTSGTLPVVDNTQGSHPEINLQSEGNRKPCLLLRGLPFTSTDADVRGFIEHAGAHGYLASQKPIVLLVNPNGRPSGFAEIYLSTNADVAEVREKLNMQRLGGRYIEVLSPHPPPRWNGGGNGGSKRERGGRDRHRGSRGNDSARSWR